MHNMQISEWGNFKATHLENSPPVFIVFTWSTNVLDGLPVIWLQALGVYPTPDTLGSSGIFVRKLSSANLNSSIEHLVMFLILGCKYIEQGRALDATFL